MFETMSASPKPGVCATLRHSGSVDERCSSSSRAPPASRARACRRGTASAARRSSGAKKTGIEAGALEDGDLAELLEHLDLLEVRLLARALVDAQLEDARRLGRGLRRQLDARERREGLQQPRLLAQVGRDRRRSRRRTARRRPGTRRPWRACLRARGTAPPRRTASARTGSAAAGRRSARTRRPGRRRRGVSAGTRALAKYSPRRRGWPVRSV